ncbi:serine/threonine-protein kinase [Nocardiopsis terrae]
MSNGHDHPAPQHPDDPRELGGYRILRRLGRGGMGTVHLAQAPSGAQVALKVIHPDLAEDESFRLRFAREVASARRVARFSTAGVIDARLDREPLFVVSEYIQGPDLARAVRRQGPMGGGTLESVAVGVAAALAAIHGSGIVHRDLKPANVLLSPVGPKVIDFGIARALEGSDDLTRSSQLMGTPSYMAPELLHGERATPAADVFAWGCLVAFAGTGRAPFDAATVPAVLHNISTAEPRLTGLDPKLLPLVTAALDKDPALRPTSQQILDQLVGHREVADSGRRPAPGDRTPTPPETPPAPTDPAPPGDQSPPARPRPSRRRALIGTGAGVAALGLTAALLYALLPGDEEPPQNLRNLYRSDFATNPDWGNNIHDEQEDPYTSGYLPGEGLMMAMEPAQESDPSSGRNWRAPAVSGVHSADRLLISTEARVEEGYDYLSFGVRCVRSLHPADADLSDEGPYPDYPDHEYVLSYRAWLRADGAQATISKWSSDEGTHDLAGGNVAEFHPYPVLTQDADDDGRGAEEAEPVSNSVRFACEFSEDEDGGAPTAELRLWVNDRLAVSATDEEPYPDEYADHQVVQRQAIHYDRGQSNEPFRVLFEGFGLDEILGE